MKKISFYILPLLCGLSVLSCNDDETFKNNPENEEETIEQDTVMSPSEQKSYIEQVAVDLAGKMPSTDFAELRDFVYNLSGIYSNPGWAQVGDSMLVSFAKCSEKIGEKEGVDTVYTYWAYAGILDTSYFIGHVDYYNVALTLSNFTGHFTASDSIWSYAEAQDLQFIFKDDKDNDCVLKLSKEGDEVRMKMWSDGGHVGSKPGDEDNLPIQYFAESDYFLCIPEKVVISLTRNGKSVTELTVSYDISDLTEDGYFDLGKSSNMGSLEFILNNGYKLSYDGKATANDKLSFSYGLSNAAGNLISYTISGDPSAVPSIVLNEEFSIGEFSTEMQNDSANVSNVYMCLSVDDNKLRMIGKVADLRTLLSLEDSIYHNWRNEEKFKAFVEEENRHLDLGLYYGDSPKKQASVEMEAYCDTDAFWNTRPVLVFSDSVRTSFEEFFSKDNFIKAIKAFEALEEDYEAFISGAE